MLQIWYKIVTKQLPKELRAIYPRGFKRAV